MQNITFTPLRATEASFVTPTPSGAGKDIDRKASEFESILLAQWLQSAETSFGSTPGADGEDDATAQQWGSFATQQLAKAISAKGGIGIGSLVGQALRHAEKNASAAPQVIHSSVSR